MAPPHLYSLEPPTFRLTDHTLFPDLDEPPIAFHDFEDEIPQPPPVNPMVIKRWIVSIHNQDDLPTILYRYLKLTSREELYLTEPDFREMWKVIILRRVQDVYEFEHLDEDIDKVAIRTDLLIPAPLFELLKRLGNYVDQENNIIHQIVPPTPNYPRRNYFTMNPRIQYQWQHDMTVCQSFYSMHPYNIPVNTTNNYLMVIFRGPPDTDDLDITYTRSYTREATPEDTKVSAVNNELFSPKPEYNFDDAPHVLSYYPSLCDTRVSYVETYTLRNAPF